jgi:ferric-dicitrate binding protein FerR (iron transport regulator)/tetratricopeptide (TPR) repeat protein
MTHEEALELLTARLAGELTPSQETILQAWIAENPDHRVLAEAFQIQDAEIRQSFQPRREAAAVTAERVVAQLPSTAAPEPNVPKLRRRRWLIAVPPLAAAAALTGVLLFFLKPTPPENRQKPDVAQSGRLPVIEGLKPKPKPGEPKPAELAISDSRATKPGEKRRLKLPDGSIVYLNENTSVKLVTDRHLKLTKGEVFVEATEANDERGRFSVETPDKTVTALGTKFEVRADDKGTGVLVTQGKVEVSGLEAPITSGHELAAGSTDILAAPRASHALSWTRELMIAADSPLIPAGKYDGGALVAVDPYGQEAKLSLVKYHIDVHIEDGFARTTIDQTYFNHENFQMEGTFYFPLPPDASLSRLAMYVSHGEESTLMEGGMAERNIARQTYEKIRYARRDPALLEWVDGSLFKMRVFPLEGRQEKRIILSYSQKLPVSYGRTSYRFPAGHSLNHVQSWSFHAFVKDGAMLSALSPSNPDMKIQAQGLDLVLDDKKANIKADKDVLVDLHESNPNGTPSVRWSSAEQDGHKYLMLRYRPQLQGVVRRERRDWVILFEASGARDPLVARAQIEILRTLLNNAEHDDTFALMTVGTRLHKFASQPVPVTPDNLTKAMKFLEQTQLIGALNLEGALQEATPWLQAGQNPYLVHVGGGVATLGEQRGDKLVSLVPKGTRYVGVGVGKRVSPAFMKVAAETTGGLFTQINPDEPIAWRAFELASTLNTPRLLNVTVEAGEKMPRFLTFTSTLSHGEELAAVARVDHAALTGVTVRGVVDGEKFEKTVPIQQIAAKADYLPRTWAKLEIDRLLAENSTANQQIITAMSKAMYVMTPFTSLLVLENDAMYKEFNIDRGRKDHWAMYPCPAKMPTVYIPDPNQPAGSGIQRVNQKPHANEVLQTIWCRTMPQYVNWSANNVNDSPILNAGQLYGAYGVPEFGAPGMSAPELSKLQRLFRESTRKLGRQDLAGEDFEIELGVQPALLFGRAMVMDDSKSTLFARSDLGTFSPPALGLNRGSSLREEKAERGLQERHSVNGIDGVHLWLGGLGEGEGRRAGDSPEMDSIWADLPSPITGKPLYGYIALGDGSVRTLGVGSGLGGFGTAHLPSGGDRMLGRSEELASDNLVLFDSATGATASSSTSSTNFLAPTYSNPFYMGRPVSATNGTNAFGNLTDNSFNSWTVGLNMQVPFGFRFTSTSSAFGEKIWYPDAPDGFKTPRPTGKTATDNAPTAPMYDRLAEKDKKKFVQQEIALRDSNARKIVDGKLSEMLQGSGKDEPLPGLRSTVTADPLQDLGIIVANSDNAEDRKKVEETIEVLTETARATQAVPAYYRRPSFSGVERVFTDVAAYAPGMNSLPADIQAVLEAEAAPRFGNRRGELTPAAKQLIDRARSTEWSVTTIGKNNPLSITHDGQGRFRCEHKVGFGLDEQVVCDGSTLYHLYPELGIGASRAVSRFHRAELVALLVDQLPPGEDLTVGADVVAVDEQTAAIVPLETMQPGEEDLPQAWFEVHLVFEGNRLAQRRLVLLVDKKITDKIADQPSKEDKKIEKQPVKVALSARAKKHQATGTLLLREEYAADGVIKVKNGADKVLAEIKRQRKACQPGNVTPDLRDLVVLPGPFRNRSTVYAKYDLDPNYQLNHEVNACVVADLSPEATMEVLAANFAENRGQEIHDLWTSNFRERGDRRRGFFTLMASAGYNMRSVENLAERAAANPQDSLLRYLFLLHDERFNYYQSHVGMLPGRETPDDFLNNLLSFRSISLRWRGPDITDSIFGSREAERKRALAFVHRHADNVWGWCALSMLSDMSTGKAFRSQLAWAWGELAEKSGVKYHALYEQARFHWLADENAVAKTKFKELFQTTLKKGMMPPLDSTFRQVLEHNQSADWSSLMSEEAGKAISENRRPLVVLLAWQAKQLGDHPMADRFIHLALKDMKPEERVLTTICAIEYLWNTNEPERADALVHGLVDHKILDKSPMMWRLSSMIAEKRGQTIRQFADLERALDLEFAAMPETFNVEKIRRDYDQLLAHYQWLADASVSLKVAPPADLLAKTIRYADRWRSLDPEVNDVCNRTASVLRTIGGDNASALAWDYVTTPLALRPNESSPWLSLAESAKREGDLALADRCYREAYTAEPTNAQILWDRAQLLQRRGHEAEARKIMRQIVDGDWQDRFSGVKTQARQIIGTAPDRNKE